MPTRKLLGTFTLVGVIYFSVSGGPYGLEELFSSSGAGMGLLLLLLVPIIFAVPSALISGELGSAIPVEGGYYQWVKIGLGRFAGFLEASWQWLNTFIDTALYPVVFADYLAVWFPDLQRGKHVLFSAFDGQISFDLHWLVAILFMIPLAWLNIRGSRFVGETSTGMMILILLPFLVLGVLGIAKLIADPEIITGIEMTLPDQSAFSAFGAGLAIVIWNFIGWDQPSTVLGEVKNPRKSYGRALAISVPLITLSYFIPMIAALASGLHKGDDSAWVDGDFASAGGMLGGPWLMIAITAGAVIGQIGLFSSLLMTGSRIPMVLAADGYLPKALARDGKYGTPTVAIIVNCIVFAIFCSMSFGALISADIITAMAALLLEFAAFLALRKRQPNLPRPFKVPGGWFVAILITVGPVALAAILIISTAEEEPLALWIGLAMLLLAVIAYPPLKRWVKRDQPDALVEYLATTDVNTTALITIAEAAEIPDAQHLHHREPDEDKK